MVRWSASWDMKNTTVGTVKQGCRLRGTRLGLGLVAVMVIMSSPASIGDQQAPAQLGFTDESSPYLTN